MASSAEAGGFVAGVPPNGGRKVGRKWTVFSHECLRSGKCLEMLRRRAMLTAEFDVSCHIMLSNRDEMSSVIRLDFSVGPFFFSAHATLGEDTISTRAATITTQIGTSRVASIHTRPSAPVHAHACDGTCAVRCPVVTAHMHSGCGEQSYGTNKSAQARLIWQAPRQRQHCVSSSTLTPSI